MPMKPLDRKIALMRRGITMAEIGRGLGVTRTHVAMVVAGKRRSPNVETAVAAALEKDPADVFPPAEMVA